MDALQLSRLYRYSKTLGLGDYLREELVASVLPQPLPIETVAETILTGATADQNWHVIKPYAWKFFNYIDTPEAAAQLVEHAHLYGSPEELYETMQRLNEHGTDYYFHVSEKTRAELVLNLWQKEMVDVYREFLEKSPSTKKLNAIEHYFVFWKLHKTADEVTCFMYFQAHERELMEAADLYAAALAIPKSYFFFVVGDLAVGLGFYPTARRLLSRIRPHDREYADALQLLLVTSNQHAAAPVTNYITELENEPHWRERLKIMARCLQDVRRQPAELNTHHAALNAVFHQPLKWVPAIPAAFSALSLLITDHLDLQNQVPSIANLFIHNAEEFHLPTLDSALWAGPLKNKKTEYWHGVALLHEYVNLANADDSYLWKAKRIIATHPRPGSPTWLRLHTAVFAWVSKSLHIASSIRDQMLDQLQITSDTSELSQSAIDAFLQQTASPSHETLVHLQTTAQAKSDLVSEKKIILKMCTVLYPRNQDLARLWQVSCDLNDFDLAWRVATIAESRQALNLEIRAWWLKNTEILDADKLRDLSADDVAACSVEFSAGEKKLWVTTVPDATVVRDLAGFQLKEHNLAPPSFVQVLPRNSWCNLFVALFHKLELDKLPTQDPAFDTAAKVVSRLALLLLPNPVQALYSLRLMQAPLPLLWTLESWILSEAYSGFRRKHLLTAKSPVVPNLRRTLLK
jgi:hypothetical protein